MNITEHSVYFVEGRLYRDAIGSTIAKAIARLNSEHWPMFHLGRRRVKKDRASKKFEGDLSIPDFERTFGLVPFGNAHSRSSTTVHYDGKRVGSMDVLILGPKGQTGFLKPNQDREKYMAGHGLADKNSTWEQNALPTKMRKPYTAEFLFPLGSFLEGDYFFEGFNSLHVETSYTYKDGRVLLDYTSLPLAEHRVKEKLDDYFKGYELKHDKPRLNCPKCNKNVNDDYFSSYKRPRIFQTRGFTPSGQKRGEFSTVMNPFARDDAYSLHQAVGLLKLDAHNTKQYNLIEDLERESTPVWMYEPPRG